MRRCAAPWLFSGFPGLFLVAWVIVAIPARGAAEEIRPGNLVGTWDLKFTAPDGNEHAPTLVLSRDGDRLKGALHKLAGADLAAKNISLKGGELTFEVNGTHEGAPYTLTFKGKPEGDTI